jgi:hypothetical protein
MSARRVDKMIGLGVLALAVFLALVPLFFGSPPEPETGSVASAAARGRRALFLMLAELGFVPEAWKEPPGRLPRGQHLLWLAGAPETWAERQPRKFPALGDEKRSGEKEPASESKERETTSHAESKQDASSERASRENTASERPSREDAAEVEVPAALRAHAPVQYRRFVEDGGKIILRYDERARHFLRDELGIDEFRDLELDADSPAGERSVRTESGEELRADWPNSACFRALAPNGRVHTLWTAARADGENEEILAVAVRVGSGEIVVLGDDAFLDNEHLREMNHGLLAVRLAEELHPGSRLLFDEYARGMWEPETATRLATSPHLFLVTAHLLLLVALFVWSRAWAKTFPRDPPALSRVSPLARARARAALFERAGRYDRLAGMLRHGSMRRWPALTRVRRVRADESAAEPLQSELDRITARVGTEESAARWREAVVVRRVGNARELEALARDLDLIGTEIEGLERRSELRAG